MHTLIKHNLIDEFRIWIHPVVLGDGKLLFPKGIDRMDLTLVDVTRFTTGAVVFAFQPAAAQARSGAPGAEVSAHTA
jgi:dihydrofolate reductase